MKPIEVIVIIMCILIVGGVIARAIYKKIKKIPSSDCACCAKKMKRAMSYAIKDIEKEI